MAIQMDSERRRAILALRAEVRELESPEREARKIEAAKRRAARERRPDRIAHQRTKPKGGHEADKPFMSWLHESGLACVACEIEGPPTPAMLQGEPNPMEVAHQRVTGWKKGVKEDDKHSCILCRWHHQLAPNACDKGQRQFWDRLGIVAADYTAALHAAFRGGSDPHRVLRQFLTMRAA